MIWPQVAAWSDVGRLREINEDRVFYQVLASSDAEPLALCIVADGMGGHLAGEVASHWAVETFKRELADLFVPADPRQTVQLSRSEIEALNEDVRRGLRPSDAAMVHRLRIAISSANTAVREYALHRPQEAMGTGSTVTLAVVKGTRAYVANVGDSRAYLLRRGRMLQLTVDHSLVAELVAAGHLAPEDAYTHPQAGVITRCLGHSDEVEADVHCHTLEPGDRLMLCSDGLWTSLREPAMMAEIVQSAPALSVAAHRLVKAANHVGGQDNISVILLHLMEMPDIPT